VLKKDLIELCLLHLLTDGDAYGYEFLHRIHESFPGTQESAIYALLRGLCREGYTEQYEGKTSGGPTRKYYRITEAGWEKLGRLLEEWRNLRDTLAALGVE
jgi:PadR family transcriptional regulator PadR